MIRKVLFAALAVVVLAAPASANSMSDEVWALLQQQLENSRKELERSLEQHRNFKIEIPKPGPIHVYRERNLTDGGPPVGWESMTIFNGYNHPILGPSRSPCMPFYLDCWKQK